MTSLSKRIATALLLSLGATGSLGCELIAQVDRSKIPGDTGSGGSSTGTGGGGGAGGDMTTTTSSNSSSGTGGTMDTCGDGKLGMGEDCDDGNTAAGDGCDALCKHEPGWTCTGAPSVCTTTCGDGVKAGKEGCDDGNTTAGDGCDDKCVAETGWTCTGDAPTTCAANCGDGQVLGAETCDDGNTTAGDGCDATCATETGWTCMGMPSACAANCGDGMVLGTETCDDGNTAAGDGCDGVCKTEAGWTCMGMPSVCATTCGDGTQAGTEACDDGNLKDLDGCSSTCHVDAFTETEPNDSIATASGPFTPAPGVIISGGVKPGSDVDYFAIVVPATADLHLETFDAAGPKSCNNIDTVVTLFAPDGTTQLATDDDSGVGSCSVIDSATTAAVAHVPAGTYYVKVEAYNNFKPIPGYTLVVTFNALCGDSKTQGHEQCDGGAGCNATCDRVQVCGDGFVEAPEGCDDGNTASGDGCDATCKYETLPETEPNDTAMTASGPFTPNFLVGGAITPATDVDYYKINLPQTADLKIATFDASGPSSCVTIDTVLTLFGTDGTTVLVNRDQGGVNDCATIDSGVAADAKARHLPAGTYFVKVESYNNATTIAGYTMLVTYNALCGNGITEGSEKCDGGAGCTATCDRVPVCGDGFVDGPEQCDDSNTTSGDGCSATCQWETVNEVEPNDTFQTANGPYTPHALVNGSINPGTDVDYFAVTLTATADLKVETFDGNGPGSCVNLDSVVTLYAPDGTTVLTSADDGGISTCSKIDPKLDPAARHLAAGTYYVKVEDFGNDTVIPAYRLELSYAALCGNGIVEGGEQCDGGAKCSATCDLLQVCGDGVISAPETCDDGNTTSGDGCSSACALETVAELEPNDDFTGADTAATAATPVQITGNTQIAGAIGAVGDEDFFKVTLAAPTTLRLETFDATGSDCAGVDTTIRIWDTTGGGTQLYADDNSGIFTCSALVVHLPAGTYYASVEEATGAATIAAYVLQARFQADDGAEAEPNDTQATANTFAGSDAFILGDHTANADSDYFAITVPAGKSVRAEIVEGGAETCEALDVDSFLTLYNSSGVALGGDDDSGRGFCSLIDGTGSSPADSYAHALAAGTYYLQVEATPFAQSPTDTTGQFAYRLAVTVR